MIHRLRMLVRHRAYYVKRARYWWRCPICGQRGSHDREAHELWAFGHKQAGAVQKATEQLIGRSLDARELPGMLESLEYGVRFTPGVPFPSPGRVMQEGLLMSEREYLDAERQFRDVMRGLGGLADQSSDGASDG